MKALLDTHVFLWWAVDDPRLSRGARAVIEDSGNTLYFSAASGWELVIKAQLGKLKLPQRAERFVATVVARLSFESLPVLLSHALRAGSLPAHHRDPFDRMLIAQSQVEGLPILTADPAISQYDVEVIW